MTIQSIIGHYTSLCGCIFGFVMVGLALEYYPQQDMRINKPIEFYFLLYLCFNVFVAPFLLIRHALTYKSKRLRDGIIASMICAGILSIMLHKFKAFYYFFSPVYVMAHIIDYFTIFTRKLSPKE